MIRLKLATFISESINFVSFEWTRQNLIIAVKSNIFFKLYQAIVVDKCNEYLQLTCPRKLNWEIMSHVQAKSRKMNPQITLFNNETANNPQYGYKRTNIVIYIYDETGVIPWLLSSRRLLIIQYSIFCYLKHDLTRLIVDRAFAFAEKIIFNFSFKL